MSKLLFVLVAGLCGVLAIATPAVSATLYTCGPGTAIPECPTAVKVLDRTTGSTRYECGPGTAEAICPATIVVSERDTVQPSPPTAPDALPVLELQQNARIGQLEQSAGRFRLEAATTYDTDSHLGFLGGIGASWLLGNELAFADAEFLVGQSEASNDGFLLGTRGNLLFLTTSWMRLGVTADLVMDFGSEQILLDPGVVAEIGLESIHVMIRESAQVSLANGDRNSDTGPLLFSAGLGGRF